ncbi:hypothetical protein [Thalassobius sp. MITS945101]|uniref:hypothetical protein n=1 Tax=Thalassobius sp. MITS945101 TaxID=3096994 RepID=UPI00399A06EA
MFRTFVIAALLTVTPMIALAGGCSGAHSNQQAMTCIEGTIWDETTRSCVKVTG